MARRRFATGSERKFSVEEFDVLSADKLDPVPVSIGFTSIDAMGWVDGGSGRGES
jgi:hypothetical protein